MQKLISLLLLLFCEMIVSYFEIIRLFFCKLKNGLFLIFKSLIHLELTLNMVRRSVSVSKRFLMKRVLALSNSAYFPIV